VFSPPTASAASSLSDAPPPADGSKKGSDGVPWRACMPVQEERFDQVSSKFFSQLSSPFFSLKGKIDFTG
jgi:hypothetical protein